MRARGGVLQMRNESEPQPYTETREEYYTRAQAVMRAMHAGVSTE